MGEDKNLCLACGLCCNGTLIGFVQLESDEVPAVKALMEVEESSGEGVFLHPCTRYCDGCTIYSQRPRQCASFKCSLLKSYESEQLEFEDAKEIIDSVNAQKEIIQDLIASLQETFTSNSFYFQMLEMKMKLNARKKEGPLQNDLLKLEKHIQQLDNIMDVNFGVSLD